MNQQLMQLLIVFIAIGAPALSWIVGKMREQHELKKARDATRRSQDEALRTTQLTDRSRPGLSPQAQRERERRDLAARRQAQLRELRQRQYEKARAAGGGAVVRAPGGVPTQPRPTAPKPTGRSGPLRPGVPSTPARRPARPMPTRPMPTAAPARRGAGAPTPGRPPMPPRPRERPAPVARPAGEVRRLVPSEKEQPPRPEQRRTTDIGASVRDMLMRPDGGPRPRADLARAFALTEVFGTPTALRSEEQLPWNRA